MNIFRLLTKRALQGSEVADPSMHAHAGGAVVHTLQPHQAAGEPVSGAPISEARETEPAAFMPTALPNGSETARDADSSGHLGSTREAEQVRSATPGPAVPQRRRSPQGLLEMPELRRFLDATHFGLGRHNGTNFRTADARERGVQAIIAEFQNIMYSLSSQKQGQIDRLKDVLLETDGVCDVTTRRLQMAIQKCESEVDALRDQIDLASRRLGWVQQPITKYELGFSQGLKVAMDAEHLGF